MTHQRLNDLLRDLMLYEMHRKRVPERLGRHRPDGKNHTVTRSGRYALAYPAARCVLTSDVPQARAGCRLYRRKPFPQPLYNAGSLSSTARGGGGPPLPASAA